MREKTRRSRRTVSLLLLLLLAMNLFCAIPFSARAATVTKAEKGYDIAVVFDNSGSISNSASGARSGV